MAYSKEIWVLFDLSNSGGEQKGQSGKNYLWWFHTKKEADAHRKKQHATPDLADLSPPKRFHR